MSDFSLVSPLSLRFYDPSRAHIGTLDGEAFTADLAGEILKYGRLTITVPFEHPIFDAEFTKNAQTKSARDWFLSEYGVEAVYNDVVVFDGCVAVTEDRDRGPTTDPADYIVDWRLECWDWLTWHLGSREIKTVDLDRFTSSGKPDDIVAALVNNAATAEPLDYPADRSLFGFHLLDADSTSAHPDTLTRARWDHGRPLDVAVREWCFQYDLDVTWTWTVPGGGASPTMHLHFSSPLAGEDTGLVFDRMTGLKGVTRTVDRGRQMNVASVRGKGWRQFQGEKYAINTEAVEDHGIREVGSDYPSGWADETEREAEFVIKQVGGAATTIAAVIEEGASGRLFGVDYGPDDTVHIFDERRPLVAAMRVSSFRVATGSPARVLLHSGRAYRGHGGADWRTVGGGPGNRRTGMHPDQTGGEPENWRSIGMDTGDLLEAPQVNTHRHDVCDPDFPCNPYQGAGFTEGTDEDDEQWQFRRICFRQIDGVAFPFELVHVELDDTFTVDCGGSTTDVWGGTISCPDPNGFGGCCEDDYASEITALASCLSATCQGITSADISAILQPCCPENCTVSVAASCCPTGCTWSVDVAFAFDVPVPAFDGLMAACIDDDGVPRAVAVPYANVTGLVCPACDEPGNASVP